ncbi:hypothetical protein KPZU09_14440 [Klebsiella pneumoniae]|uniref:Uncharacterized protein n=1 Tax=Klebsiella pneumoniae TaxID=573 RepID=A0A919HNE1_KLEPN|nr:hypothetical protein KPZU09_14440 [Klebsiella pneumoniae]
MVNPAEIMLSRLAARLHPRQQQRADQITSVIGRRGEIARCRVNRPSLSISGSTPVKAKRP